MEKAFDVGTNIHNVNIVASTGTGIGSTRRKMPIIPKKNDGGGGGAKRKEDNNTILRSRPPWTMLVGRDAAE